MFWESKLAIFGTKRRVTGLGRDDSSWWPGVVEGHSDRKNDERSEVSHFLRCNGVKLKKTLRSVTSRNTPVARRSDRDPKNRGHEKTSNLVTKKFP